MSTNTNGGTLASLDNTPQAKDDFYSMLEDQWRVLDVMAKDRGGNAKPLWSIDTTSDDGVQDLVAKDVVGVVDNSEMCAAISLTADGKILYDTRGSAAITALAAGQTAVDQFTYAIRLSNGTLSWATVNVTITGSNDGPDISVGAADKAAVTLNETNAALSSYGTLTVSDPDTADTVNIGVTSVAASGTGGTNGISNADLLAMLSLTGNVANAGDGTPGSLHWAFNSTPEAFNYLATGETLVLTYTLTANDGQGGTVTQTVTVTVTGTNDVPQVAAALTSNVAEGDPGYSLDLLTGASDKDDGETASLSVANVTYKVGAGSPSATAPAGLSLVGSSLSVDPSNAAFDHLAVGDSVVIVVGYDVTDAQGATVHQTETITITGTNDVPEVAAALDRKRTRLDSSYTVNLYAGSSEKEDGETASLSVANVTYKVGAGSPSATAPAGLSLVGSSLSLNPSNAALVHPLSLHDALPIFGYDVTDAQGATVHQTETITITGTNDVPEVAAALTSNVAEGDPGYSLDLLTGASDKDDGETASLSVANVTYKVGAGSPSATAPAGLSLVGSSLSVDPSNGAFDHLAVGDSVVIVVGYDVTDAQGATVHQTETITITGTNDVPQVAAALTSNVAEGDPGYSLDLLTGASDKDDGETASLSVANVTYKVVVGSPSATPPAGSCPARRSSDLDPSNAAFDHLAVGDSVVIVVGYDVKD